MLKNKTIIDLGFEPKGYSKKLDLYKFDNTDLHLSICFDASDRLYIFRHIFVVSRDNGEYWESEDIAYYKVFLGRITCKRDLIKVLKLVQ